MAAYLSDLAENVLSNKPKIVCSLLFFFILYLLVEIYFSVPKSYDLRREKTCSRGIMLTCPCNVYPHAPYFYIAKLYIFKKAFVIQNFMEIWYINLRKSLEIQTSLIF